MSLPEKKDGGGLPATTEDEGIMDRIKQPALQLTEELFNTLQAAQEGVVSVVVRPPASASGDVRNVAERFFTVVHGEFELLSFEIHQTASGQVEFHMVVPSSEDDRLITYLRSVIDGIEVDVEPATLPVDQGDTVVSERLEYTRDHILPLLTARSPTDNGDDPYGPLLSLMEDSFGVKSVIQFTTKPVQPTGLGRLRAAASNIDGRLRPTWTTRWSRWIPKSLRYERRAWLPSLVFSAMLGGVALAAWTLLGGWPIQATPLWPFASEAQLPLTGRITFWGLMAGLAVLALVSTLGDGLSLWRLTAEEMAEQFRDHPHRRSTSDERSSAEVIGQQSGEPGYCVSLRVLSAAESAQKARSHQGKVVKQIQNATRNPTTHQQLTAGAPQLKRWRVSLLERTAARSVRAATRRNWLNKVLLRATRRRPMFMAPFELALAHWPEKASGGASVVRFSSVTDAESMPPHARSPADEEGESISAGAPPQPEFDDEAENTQPAPDVGAAEAESDSEGSEDQKQKPTVEAQEERP